MSLIPAKEYYGKDESITSVCASLLVHQDRANRTPADTMAEDEEAKQRGKTGRKAGKA